MATFAASVLAPILTVGDSPARAALSWASASGRKPSEVGLILTKALN